MMLPSGVPKMYDYDRLLASDLFRELRTGADAFLTEHRRVLAPYSRRWVSDPLHHWSRQWEYPYAWERVRAMGGGSQAPLRLLDAGSGVTFFPYLVANTFGHEVTCVDIDTGLAPVHAAIRQTAPVAVSFQAGDLKELPFPDGAFDAAWCLSVLEHVSGYRQAIREFGRVLRPGGQLIMSFDLSIDGDSEISLSAAEGLIAAMRETFPQSDVPAVSMLAASACSEDAVTTQRLARRDRTLMPWSGPWVCVLRALRKGRLPAGLGYTNLGFACATLAKGMEAS